jgi:isopentenyldiphosphate isomerase
MPDEMVDIVDLEGRITGSALKSIAHQQKLLHPIVRVILLNPRDEVYLQQRAADKDVYPNRWEGSMAEHVRKSEGYIDAAQRGVQEEFMRKLRPQSFKEVGRFANAQATDHPAYSILYVVRGVEWRPRLSSEAQACAWISRHTLTQEVRDIPDKYTPGFIAAWRIFQKRGTC